MSKWLPSVCPHDCPDTCGLLVRVEGGKITAVKGDPEHPFTQGFVCNKVAQYPQRIHSPQRLTKPLLRSGSKGSGQFQEISWDRALDIIEHRLGETIAQHGAEAVLPYRYAGHMGLVHRHIGHAFFHRLGASLLGWTICGATASTGYQYSLGRGPGTDIESSVDSDLILIWGNNTQTSNLHAWPFFKKARAKGARIVVIDPYQNRTAGRADRHIMLRPGSDAALALGLMQVLIAEDLVDHDFIAAHTVGFERFKEVAQAYTPEEAEKVSGVPAAEIVRLARDYARARAPFLRLGWGPARQLKGGMAQRTIALLPALVGAFNKKGGGIVHSNGAAAPLNLARLTREDLAPAGARSVNMVQLGHGLTKLTPPIKMLYVYLSNPAVVAPDSSQVLAGLARDDLFTVVHEMFMTETARYADLVLPGASSMEITDLYRSYGHFYMQLARPVIPPPGECRSQLEVFQELARRLGFSDDVFTASEDEIISWLLETDSPYLKGITLQRLADCRPLHLNVSANPHADGFVTPSGKVEFYSEAMAAAGLDPLPNGEPSRDPDGEGVYPLQLITPPKHQFLNSSFNEIPVQREKAGPASLLMNAADAKARGIGEGQLVRVFNGRGEAMLLARPGQRVLPGVTVAEGLYWGEYSPGGKGANHLTSQRVADMGGSNAFHCNLVEVEAAD